ncbi:MAG: aminotransferase class I/II-fold pyridoxal phosphate-dependent enzyme [Coriobacteriia bacterium]|nr:aminotransferase class I/II-fold pyridoxal phosphate-dependent enzyme [Coriobacteriia bacterium]
MSDSTMQRVLEAELARLRALSGIKWSRYDEDVLACWIADMDLPSAPVVAAAVRDLVERRDFGYDFSAVGAVSEAWAAWQLERHGWSPDPARVRLHTDVLQAVDLALWLGTNPGDGVVLMTPVYPPFFRCLASLGRTVVDCPLEPGTWELDAERLEAVVAAGVDDGAPVSAILMCNPHNPTGRVFSVAELTAVAEVARRHDLLVISDEIWADVVYPGARHVPFRSLPVAEGLRTVTAAAASKTFNIAGLRCAVSYIDDEALEEKISALPDHLLGAVSSVGATATLAAYSQGGPWLEATLVLLQGNRDHVIERLAAELPRAVVDVPEATYLAWIDLRAYELGEDPAAWLLEHARVALNAGPDFGVHGHGFVRLNFATTRPVLDEIIDRIVRALG